MLLVERHKDSIFCLEVFYPAIQPHTVTTIQPMHPHCKHQVTDHILNINPNLRRLLRYFSANNCDTKMKYKQRKQPDGGCFLKVVYNILISYVNRVKVLSNTFYFNYEYLLIFNYYLSISYYLLLLCIII